MSPAAPHAPLSTQLGPVEPLREIDDLYDADLDLLLADRLAESAGALRAAVTAATLAIEIGPAALAAHTFGEKARRLAC